MFDDAPGDNFEKKSNEIIRIVAEPAGTNRFHRQNRTDRICPPSRAGIKLETITAKLEYPGMHRTFEFLLPLLQSAVTESDGSCPGKERSRCSTSAWLAGSEVHLHDASGQQQKANDI